MDRFVAVASPGGEQGERLPLQNLENLQRMKNSLRLSQQ